MSRHPLDFSAPRISDLPPEEAKAAMHARALAARDTWLRNRQSRPIVERFTNLFRGTPPVLGRGDSGHQLPSAVATDHIAGAGKAIG